MPFMYHFGRRQGMYQLTRDLSVVDIVCIDEQKLLQWTVTAESTGHGAMEYIAQRLEAEQVSINLALITL